MSKYCEICGNTENLKYFLLDACEYDNNGKITKFIDGGVYFCNDCLSGCNKCSKCNKLKPTSEIKNILTGWNSTEFCSCE